MNNTAAIILAAGSGTRMKAGQNKLFLELNGKAVLEYTVAAFQRSRAVDAIVIVAKAEELERVQAMIPQQLYDKIIAYTAGGKERQDSVLCGLRVTDALLEDLLAQLMPGMGTIAGVPAKDTMKRVNAEGIVLETPVRSELWNIQTPQCFYTNEILSCYERALEEGYSGTDDASLAEKYGLSVRVVPAYYENIKLTSPEDLDVAEIFLKRLHME